MRRDFNDWVAYIANHHKSRALGHISAAGAVLLYRCGGGTRGVIDIHAHLTLHTTRVSCSEAGEVRNSVKENQSFSMSTLGQGRP